MALKSHAWFFMQHRDSKQPPWSPSHLMKPVDTNKIYFGDQKWNDRLLSFNIGIQQLLSHKSSHQLQIPKRMVQKPKIKSVYFWLSWLISSFLCNIKALKNNHETPLILWNLWTPIKLILMAKSGVNNDFLSYCWNPAIPIYNQGLKNNKKELVCQN